MTEFESLPLFTWGLVSIGIAILGYVVLLFEKPIPQQVGSLIAGVWFAFIALPYFFDPIPYLHYACALGTALAVIIGFLTESSDTGGRPGPMGV